MNLPRPLLVAIVAFAFYAVSLGLPAFQCTSRGFLGYEVLVFGWAGLLALDPRWFANVGFLVLFYRCIPRFQKHVPGILFGTGLLALFSFAPAAGCADAGGAPGIAQGLAIGGYIWMLAILLACTANLLVPPKPRDAPPLEPPAKE